MFPETDVPTSTKIIIISFPIQVTIAYLIFRIIVKIARHKQKKTFTVEVTGTCCSNDGGISYAKSHGRFSSNRKWPRR